MPAPRRIEIEPELSQQLFLEVIRDIPVTPAEAYLEVETGGPIEKITMRNAEFDVFRSARLPGFLIAGCHIRGAKLRPYSDVSANIHLAEHQRCAQATLIIARLDESRFNRVGAVMLNWWNELERKYPQMSAEVPTNS